ncbi:MAG: glycosyltransferase family 4 protein [Candidatus Berkelbacteria bacterium]|nr:glycosyltransferase family 4 protein [Candidatus Berkelbacteria bacterium]
MKLKVLFLMKFPLFGGGSGNYTRKLAEKLSLIPGVEVAIAAPDSRPVEGVKLYTLKPQRKVVFESHPEYPGAKKYKDLTAAEFDKVYLSFFTQILSVVDEFRPDVIHVNHTSFLTWIASYIKSIYNIPYVVTAHGTDIFQATIDKRFLVLTRQALERSQYILSNSNYTNKWLLKVFGRQLQRKTRIIPCGVDLQAYQRSVDVDQIEEKYDLKGKKVVIFVGRLTWEKGVDYLLRAAPAIKGEVFIIGSGVEKKRLEKYAKAKKLSNVHFLGYFGKEYVDELRQFYKRANCVVLPSVCDEGLGISILEAMASETPVVATNKGGIPLAVRDGKTGFLVRAKSHNAISDAVNKILANDKLRQELGKNARKLVEEKFDWLKIRDKILKYYTESTVVREKIKKKNLPDGLTEKDLEREHAELQKKIDYIP